MNILISVITFPLFFSLWLYCQFCEYCLMPLYTSFMRLCARKTISMKLMLAIGQGYIYLVQSQAASYQILVGNKDLWQVWLELFDDF